MLDKTLGIVLGTIPYNDNTQFVHIYTEKFGKVTYRTLTSVKRTRKSQQQKLLFAPTTKLELDVLHSDTQDLQQIKDATLISSPFTIGIDNPKKYSQCLYIAELLDKSIKEIEHNYLLWKFITNSLDVLYMSDENTEDFHLLFTAKLCIPLGFGINESEYKPGMQFDLQEGRFTSGTIPHAYYLNSISAEYLYRLLCSDYSNIGQLGFSNKERSIMLDILLAYLKIHIPEIGELKSLDVLKAIYT